MSEITDETFGRVDYLICEYARLCNRTNTEVVHALLGSKTLKRYGYRDEQGGHLSEEQGQVAVLVLEYWIGVRNGDL